MQIRKVLAFLYATVATLLVSGAVFAQEAGAEEAGGEDIGWRALAAGLGIGMAALGGSLGQGRVASAALEGIARNPNASGKIFTPMILGLALIESLVIYALIISLMIQP